MSGFSTISSWVTGTLFPEATLFTVCFFLTVQAPASSPSLPVLLRARDDSTLESCRFCPGARPFGKLDHFVHQEWFWYVATSHWLEPQQHGTYVRSSFESHGLATALHPVHPWLYAWSPAGNWSNRPLSPHFCHGGDPPHLPISRRLFCPLGFSQELEKPTHWQLLCQEKWPAISKMEKNLARLLSVWPCFQSSGISSTV